MYDKYSSLKTCTQIWMFTLTTMKPNFKGIHTRKFTFNILVYWSNIYRVFP